MIDGGLVGRCGRVPFVLPQIGVIVYLSLRCPRTPPLVCAVRGSRVTAPDRRDGTLSSSSAIRHFVHYARGALAAWRGVHMRSAYDVLLPQFGGCACGTCSMFSSPTRFTVRMRGYFGERVLRTVGYSAVSQPGLVGILFVCPVSTCCGVAS